MMKTKVRFKSFRDVADFDYGVKGFEIKFQESIEKFLEENGIYDPWWKYYCGSIFEEVWEIYQKVNDDYQLLKSLKDLYKKIEEEVTRRVEEGKPVTLQEREEEGYRRHPELREIMEGRADEELIDGSK